MSQDSAEHVDVIVVGSGFGGAVAAARLAQAGLSVTVLERGRRWRLGEYPRRPDLHDGWLWQVDGGLYDVRYLDRMTCIQAAGWGGGSLAYANVFARPADEVLDPRWPSHLRRDRLDPYYDLAAHMLEVRQVAEDPATGQVPERTRVMEDLVRRMDVPDATVRPTLAVRFGDPDTWRPNVHGVPQRGCSFVGECVLGCNQGAKNSLDHNYLAVAEAAGAVAVTGAEVRLLEPVDGGWAVLHGDPARPDAPLVRRTATRVFLAAGAVATTELLLRARDVSRTMPGLSLRLGEGFSGNGDFLATTNLRRGRGDLTRGPTITTTTVLDVEEGARPVWFQVQDGAFPLAVQQLVDSLLPLGRVRHAWSRWRRTDPHRSFAFLSMGVDSAGGLLRLDGRGRATLRWSNRREARLYRAEQRVGPAVARLLGSPIRSAVTWRLFRRAVTVHALGGVPVGADVGSGVVDDAGEVHGYPGLVVVDGSVLPAATGVNPSATILAVAERAVEHHVRRITGDGSWRAPEWAAVRPAPVPEDAAFRWMAQRRAATAGDGLTFEETMATAPRDGGRVVMHLDAEVRSLHRFLAGERHEATVAGTFEVAGLATRRPVEGTLSMFPDDSAELMRYELRFDDDRGQPWSATGVKRRAGRGPLAVLRALTTLHLTLERLDGGAVRTSVLLIPPAGVVRLGLSLRGVGFTRARRVRAAARFVGFFARRSLRLLR